MKINKALIAKVINSHGILGEVKLKVFLENIENIVNYRFIDENDKILEVENIRSFKDNIIIVKFKHITNRNEADTIKNISIFADNSSFTPTNTEEYYYKDLIGLKVFTSKQEEIGVVRNISNFGAGDLLEIFINSKEDTEFFRFTKEIIPEINIEQGYLIVAAFE